MLQTKIRRLFQQKINDYPKSSIRIIPFLPASSLVLFISACASQDITMIDTKGTEDDADKQLIVDCLLPGRIKRLGAGATFVTPRRPAKLPAFECEDRGGEYVAYDQANSASALKVWLGAAQDGNKVAQTYVGEIYEKGMGIQPDYELAAKWYLKAASQGHSRAMLNLGYLYEKGLGVSKNLAVALNLYRKASGLDDTDIEFESVIDVATVDSSVNELRQLKHNLEDDKREIAVINEKIVDSQAKLQQQQQELQAQSEKLYQQRQELQRKKNQLSQQQQVAAADRDLINRKEKELSRKEAELNNQLAEIDKIMAQAPEEVAAVEPQVPPVEIVPIVTASAGKLSIAGPSIELISPQVINIRGGVPSVSVREGTKTREIVGRISSPAGLNKLTINNQQGTIDNNGVFKILLPINSKTLPVKIVAQDQLGKQTGLEFKFVQSNKTGNQVVATPPAVKTSAVAGEFGHFYALVIGNNGYKQFPQLGTAVSDAKSVANILSNKYGFKSTTLVNANRFMILATLNRLSKKLTDKDNLLIYYAGHGELASNKEVGYWLPVDADKNNKRKWIANTAISDVINAMNVKRVLVIADSCYAGALTRSSLAQAKTNMAAAERITWLRAMAKSKARLALTSGGLQPVSDEGTGNHSLFANALINVLEANNSIMEGQRLFNQLHARISIGAAAMNIEQTPEYAPIRHTGHESGEFFFLPARS